MKTNVQELKAVRINVRLKVSEAQDIVDYISGDPGEAPENVAKLGALLAHRLEKISG